MGALATSAPDFWIKADAITGLTDGASIATVVDQSGHGHNAGAGTIGPTYKTNQSPTGLPVMRFRTSGGEQSLDVASVAAYGTETIFVVATLVSVASGINTFQGGSASGALQFRTNAANLDAIKQSVAAIGSTTTSPLSASTYYVLALRFVDGTSYEFFVNGTSVASGTTSQTTSSAVNTTIGKNPSGSGEGLNGDIGEFACWHRALTNTEIANITTELSTKWISAPISGTFSTALDDAVFSATGTETISGVLAATLDDAEFLSLAPPPKWYLFEPPTHEEPIRTTEKPLCYYRLTYANSIVRINGVLTSVRNPSQDTLTAAGTEGIDFFLGGRVYTVDGSTSDALVAAGFTTTLISTPTGYGIAPYGVGGYGY